MHAYTHANMHARSPLPLPSCCQLAPLPMSSAPVSPLCACVRAPCAALAVHRAPASCGCVAPPAVSCRLLLRLLLLARVPCCCLPHTHDWRSNVLARRASLRGCVPTLTGLAERRGEDLLGGQAGHVQLEVGQREALEVDDAALPIGGVAQGLSWDR